MASVFTKKVMVEQTVCLKPGKRSLSLESDDDSSQVINNENISCNLLKRRKLNSCQPESELLQEKDMEDSSYLLEYTRPADDGLYANSIYELKFTNESDLVITEPVFGIVQTEIDAPSYISLIGFLFDIYHEQDLQFSTLILALHLLDQVIASFSVKKQSFYLIGASCLTLASKLEEIYPVDASQLLQAMKFTHTKEELYSMERRIFQKLQYQLSIPTRYQFAVYFSYHLQFTSKQQHLLFFLIVLSFLDFNLNYEKMSNVAASAAFLVMQMSQGNRLRDPTYISRFEKVTRYSESKLIDGMLRLRKLHELRYELPNIKNILSYFSEDGRDEVNIIYYTINYHDLIVHNPYLLPRNEKDYQFQENALAHSTIVVLGTSSKVDRSKQSSVPSFQHAIEQEALRTRILKPTR